jgi:hypothetical protein
MHRIGEYIIDCLVVANKSDDAMGSVINYELNLKVHWLKVIRIQWYFSLALSCIQRSAQSNHDFYYLGYVIMMCSQFS